MIGILIRFSSGMWHPFVVTWNLRSFVCVTTFYQSSETLSSTFLNFFFAVLDFLLLIRTLSSVSRLSLFRSSLSVATGTLYTCSPSLSSKFLKKVEKSFQKNSRPLIVNKKEQDLFFPALLVIMKNQPIMDVKGRVHTIYHRACRMV